MKKILAHMIDELQSYKGKDRSTLFYEAVKTRLQKSYDSYDHDMTQSLEYLTRRNELNVAKKLSTKCKKK